jgi:molybdopterin molybdotransferase
MKKKPLITVSEALQIVLEHIQSVSTEALDLNQCFNRVLREDLTIPFDSPPFDRTAMDGYALAGESPDLTYIVTSRIAAGSQNSVPLLAGECARIFTGAPIPPGADRVAIQEDCIVENDRIRVTHPVEASSNIRFRGEDGRAGEQALSKQTILGPAQIGVAASFGKAALLVSKQPLVWVLSTGAELAELGHPLQPGEIYNSNGPQLASQIISCGGRPHLVGILKDDLAVIKNRIQEALKNKADVICIGGGASVGDEDYTRPALEACGFTVHFHGVDLKPGKPTLFATNGKTLAFGIPGNPVSHLAVFALFISPALRALMALPPLNPFVAILEAPWKGPIDKRDRWLPAFLRRDGSKLKISILASKGSGDLIACRQANVMANIPGPVTSLPTESQVAYMPLAND